MDEPSLTSFAAHAFDYDAETADEKLMYFLQRFYTFSDDRDAGDEWASHFSQDAVMRKADTDVSGRTGMIHFEPL